jgi:hypothetical protein
MQLLPARPQAVAAPARAAAAAAAHAGPAPPATVHARGGHHAHFAFARTGPLRPRGPPPLHPLPAPTHGTRNIKHLL